MNRRRRCLCALAAAFMSAGGCSMLSNAGDGKAGPAEAAPELMPGEALAGLPGVYVYVHVPENLRHIGLDDTAVRKEVALRLRRSGVDVLSHDQMLDTPGMPSLDVNINGVADATGTSVVYNVRVSVSEKARLLRPPYGIVNTRVWNAATVAQADMDELSSVYDVACETVDRFIAAYVSANSSG